MYMFLYSNLQILNLLKFSEFLHSIPKSNYQLLVLCVFFSKKTLTKNHGHHNHILVGAACPDTFHHKHPLIPEVDSDH